MYLPSSVLVVTGLCLISNALAHEHENHSTRNDLRCPAGEHPTFVHNSYTYVAPLHKFTNITRSFFDLAWYAGSPATSTEGKDNTPGAVRIGAYAGASYRETLTEYTFHPGAMLAYTYHGAPANFGGVKLGEYAETMRLESICGGRATYIDILTYACSPDQAKAYDLWYVLHMATFQGLATKVGARVMAGDCPSKDSHGRALTAFFSGTEKSDHKE
ncbi:hypothetical protein C8R43DRAFT_1162204 [Mycena crocata]|nr:hypothetical protein C8R43DRAFT_1162204 [Mycena crocata]